MGCGRLDYNTALLWWHPSRLVRNMEVINLVVDWMPSRCLFRRKFCETKAARFAQSRKLTVVDVQSAQEVLRTVRTFCFYSKDPLAYRFFFV